jgi:hypothetical protein
MRTTFLEKRVAVEGEVEVPDGMMSFDSLVDYLGYPVELFGVSNRSLPPTRPGDNPDGFPRVALLDAASFLLWVIIGDYAYEQGATNLTGPGGVLSESEIRERPSQDVMSVPALSAHDEVLTVTSDVVGWVRRIDVSPRHYVGVYGFAGGAGRLGARPTPPAALRGLVASLTFRDYS